MKTKIIIIGGVAAGTSAAAKLRRLSEEAEITLYEKDKYISYATCGLPYFVSGVIPKLNSLIINSEELFSKRFNISVKTRHEVLKINTGEKSLSVKDLESGEVFKDNYDKLIIATGSIGPDFFSSYLEADNCFQLKTIEDTVKIKEYLNCLQESEQGDLIIKNKSEIEAVSDRKGNLEYADADAVVIGGGYIGVEILEYFIETFKKVVLIEKEGSILNNFDMEITEYLENYLISKGLILLKNDSVKDIKIDEKNHIEEIITESNKKIKPVFVFLSTGFVPNTGLAKGCLIQTGNSGSIIVDGFLKTSIEDIFAIGDCIETKNLVSEKDCSFYLATLANKQGRIAAYNILGESRQYRGSIGTSIIKCFDIYMGKTGLSFREARKINPDAAKIECHIPSHSGYYPDSSMVHILIVFDRKSGGILGFEAIGKEGVDKKVDIISTAMAAKMKINALAELDLSYHPSCGSAKDAINILGMIGDNLLNDTVEFIDCEKLREKLNGTKNFDILDVRTKNEFDRSHIDGSILIPLDELRDHLDKLDTGKEMIIYCRSGYRAYLAYRIMKNNGFINIKCLNGSYESWVRNL